MDVDVTVERTIAAPREEVAGGFAGAAAPVVRAAMRRATTRDLARLASILERWASLGRGRARRVCRVTTRGAVRYSGCTTGRRRTTGTR